MANDSPTARLGPGPALSTRKLTLLFQKLNDSHYMRIFLKGLECRCLLFLVPWFGTGWAKETQGYNPELPILQGPALHIFIKHVCHVVKLVPGDGDSCGREQLLAGAAMTGRIRGSLEQPVTNTGSGAPDGQEDPACVVHT